MRRVLLAGVLLGGASIVGACVEQGEVEDKPAAPDLSATVAAYDSPTLPLNDETGEGVLDFVDDAYGIVEDLEIVDQVLDPILEALEEESPSDGGAGGAAPSDVEGGGMLVRPQDASPSSLRSKTQPLTLEGDGFLRVTRVCEGWDEPVVDEDKNGALRAIIGFTDSGLDPVIWGDFSSCRYVTPAGDVLLEAGNGELDAGVALYLGPSLQAEDLTSTPLLFVLNVDATIVGERQEVRLSFRLDQQTRRLEFLFETSEGSMVLVTEEGDLAGVRAANGDFTCTGDGLCTSGDGAEVQL